MSLSNVFGAQVRRLAELFFWLPHDSATIFGAEAERSAENSFHHNSFGVAAAVTTLRMTHVTCGTFAQTFSWKGVKTVLKRWGWV
jgi:hypothetical protein